MKPKHLSKEYGDQFQDVGIVERYRERPPYQQNVIDILMAKLTQGARVLDLGCGTGEIAIPLSERGVIVDAVDPSSAMIEKAKTFGAEANWHCCYAEDFSYEHTYDLIVTANSLHWMDWTQVFPLFKKSLTENGSLAIITGGDLTEFKGQTEVLKLVIEYSTNQDFEPFSLTDLLVNVGHLKIEKSVEMNAEPFSQSITSYIESIHARNGFSIERMGSARAEEFDKKVSDVLAKFGDDVSGVVNSTVTFGQPV
jgi:SAM-dependent methyltransferase